jgi:predicted dehydrogenase
MEKVLQIGVIGLDRRWQKRYRPALRALRDRFQVTVLCDQMQERAVRQAKRMACLAAGGVTHLLEREDLNAVLLLDLQWFGLWPLQRACQLGKPVLCCCSLEWDDAYADALNRQVKESQVPIVMELAPRFMPATVRLRDLLDTELGAPRLLLCEVVRPEKATTGLQLTSVPESSPVAGLLDGHGIALLDWCAGLIGDQPVKVTARTVEGLGFTSLFLEFTRGRAVQILRRRGVGERSTIRLQIEAERGSARVELPNQLSWVTKDGDHSHTLPQQRSVAQLLLERFYEMIQGDAVPEPTLGEAYRVLQWLRIASRSRAEGRVLTLQE